MSASRRLAAIMVADVVGYSRLMEMDEAGTLAALRERRKTILEPVVREHSGRVVKLMGDGVLIEFASAVKAVEAAVELQRRFAEANQPVPQERGILLRIGINLGDVIGEGSDIYGDGVNIAARLEALSEPGGVCISGKVHDELRGRIEARFEDIGDQHLKNLSHPVRAFRSRIGHSQPAQQKASDVDSRLSIAVLPFDNLSGDPAQQYVSDGITEDIITELARFKGLSVAARHASFHYAEKGNSLTEVARQLGVEFIVEGSVRKSAQRIRVTAQLIEARSGNHVWAERYDRDSQDIFTIQDQLVASIVSMLEDRMVATKAAIARSKPTASWSAYECLLQGRELCNNYREPESVPYFARAIALDPEFALAHAWLAIASIIADYVALDSAQMNEADKASKRALELDANDATSQWARALFLFWTGDLERAQRCFERAIALNPADIQIRGDFANLQRVRGNAAEALAMIDNALKLGPYVPIWFGAVRGQTLFDLGRYVEAVQALEPLPPHYSSGSLYLAAGYAYLGDDSAAARAIVRLKDLRPELSLRHVARVIVYAEDSARQHFFEGLRRAGLTE